VHKSEKFWHENAARLNEKNFELLKSVYSCCVVYLMILHCSSITQVKLSSSTLGIYELLAFVSGTSEHLSDKFILWASGLD